MLILYLNEIGANFHQIDLLIYLLSFIVYILCLYIYSYYYCIGVIDMFLFFPIFSSFFLGRNEFLNALGF